MVPAHQDRATEVPAAGEAVDPGDRVPVAVVARESCEGVVEIDGSFGVDGHPGGVDGDEPDGGTGGDAGQAETASGRLEDVGRRLRIDTQDVSGWGDQLEGLHVGREGAIDVMVLPVDVARERPADAHHLRPRRDGREEPERERPPHERVQRHAGADGGGAGLDVDRLHAVEPERVDDEPSRALRRVSVRSPAPAGDRTAFRGRREKALHVLRRARSSQLRGTGGSGPAPAAQEHRAAHPR
ncbi:MAG: hypothetical protein M5U27_02430 [Gaiella sp.]|nr:hypothetical protein [Gaiella sp.]